MGVVVELLFSFLACYAYLTIKPNIKEVGKSTRLVLGQLAVDKSLIRRHRLCVEHGVLTGRRLKR